MHTHEFKGVTTYVDGHLHLFSGVSSASPNIRGHTHVVEGTTTTDSGHSHNYSLTTWPQTDVNAGHYHYYEGATAISEGHDHPMSGTTFVLGE